MGRNKHKSRVPEPVVELPEDFKRLLRSKLKQQDKGAYKKALKLYADNELGYVTVINAKPGEIDITAIFREKERRKQEAQKKLERWEERGRYWRSLEKIYSSEAAEKDIIQAGGYCAAIEEGVIVVIDHEQGNARQGGTVYENTKYNHFVWQLESTLAGIKRDFPEMYELLTPYLPATIEDAKTDKTGGVRL